VIGKAMVDADKIARYAQLFTVWGLSAGQGLTSIKD
jgi:hypothetical protein